MIKKHMGNIFDYLEERGNITLAEDPFSEADNLVLAELAYTDFDGIVPPPEEKIVLSIEEVTRQYFAMHTQEEILARKTFTAKAPLLLPVLAASRRFGGMRIGGYVNTISEADSEQMAAVTFYLEDGTAYAAFRGTDNTIVGWKEDFHFGYMGQTCGQKDAVAYLNAMFQEDAGSIRVGGHSKGGNFAVYAAAFCEPNVQDRIIQVYCNDGPGFVEEVVDTDGYRRIAPRVESFIPQQSVFGLLLNNSFSHQVILSSGKGIMQHDALTWQIQENRFVPMERVTALSTLTDRTLTSWIEGLERTEREAFVDALFALLSAPGAETFRDLRSDPKHVPVIGQALAQLDNDQLSALQRALTALARSGGEAVGEELKSGTDALITTAKERSSALIDTVVSEAQRLLEQLRKG